jgi:hypothetical protein
VKLRVLPSLLLLFFLAPQFPACQLAAQLNSNNQKFSRPAHAFRFTYNYGQGFSFRSEAGAGAGSRATD